MVLMAALQLVERHPPRLSPRIAGMSMRAQAAFDRRFRREVAGRDGSAGEGFVQRSCSQCSRGCLEYAQVKSPLCFTCSHSHNPYAEKNIRMSIEAEPQPSTNPVRVADGTAEYNMGLPGVPGDVIGKDAYGQVKRKVRPVHFNEVASARKRRELAKRAGLTPLDSAKKAVG